MTYGSVLEFPPSFCIENSRPIDGPVDPGLARDRERCVSIPRACPRVIHRRGPWRSFETVADATLGWVDGSHHRHLLTPIGNVPPAEAEARTHAGVGDHAP